MRPLAAELLRRRRVQDADPQARRHAACSPAAHGDHEALARSSSSTASPTAWSTPSAPATRCSPMRRCACWRRKCEVTASILGSMAAACECETRRQHPGHASRTCTDKLDAVEREAQLRCSGRPCASSSSGSASRATSAGASPAPTSSPRSIRSIREADFRAIADVPLDATTRRSLCIPDEPKIELLGYLLGNGKHVLVEKPLCRGRRGGARAAASGTRATQGRRLLHRLQSPLRAALRAHARSGQLGRAGRASTAAACSTATARRGSCATPPGATRAPACCPISARICSTPRASGSATSARISRLVSADCFENRAPDHVVFAARGAAPAARVRDDAADLAQPFHLRRVRRERQRAHPLAVQMGAVRRSPMRTRVLPSGRPPEESVTLVQDDPTWALEYAHFKTLCARAAADRSRRTTSGSIACCGSSAPRRHEMARA